MQYEKLMTPRLLAVLRAGAAPGTTHIVTDFATLVGGPAQSCKRECWGLPPRSAAARGACCRRADSGAVWHTCNDAKHSSPRPPHCQAGMDAAEVLGLPLVVLHQAPLGMALTITGNNHYNLPR